MTNEIKKRFEDAVLCANNKSDIVHIHDYCEHQDALLAEAVEILKRNLKDMNGVDEICRMAGVHPYSLMRKDIEQFLEKYKEQEK